MLEGNKHLTSHFHRPSTCIMFHSIDAYISFDASFSMAMKSRCVSQHHPGPSVAACWFPFVAMSLAAMQNQKANSHRVRKKALKLRKPVPLLGPVSADVLDAEICFNQKVKEACHRKLADFLAWSSFPRLRG